MDSKGNLILYNPGGSVREVIPAPAGDSLVADLRESLAAADVEAEMAEAIVEEIKATAEVYRLNRHERRKAAALARRGK
jgi:signal recognition particle GTPase